MKTFHPIIVALALVAGGCSSTANRAAAPGPGAPAFASPTELTGSFRSPDTVLHWKNHAAADGGTIVEFNLMPPEEYTILAFLPPATDSFHHEDVAENTRFHYRLRPFFGRPSPIATITTGKIPQTDTSNLEQEGPLPDGTAGTSTIQRSIRSMATFAQAAPTDLTAARASPTSIDLRWHDCASDEDGYLLEISVGAPDDFQVCALLPRDTTSFKKIFLQPDTSCYFRVRAFFYGAPTEPVTVTTPAGTNTQVNNL